MVKITKSFSLLINSFIYTESASSTVLALATLIAIVAANSSASGSYFHFFEMGIAGLSIQHWINEGLMTVFFFIVGMEIKREVIVGELSDLRKAALPISAAIGGMLVPTMIFLWINSHVSPLRGWAIPMATDIAFALGVLAILGKRVPVALKVFLLTLAIVDDLGAVLVIAIFYTDQIHLIGFCIALMAITVIFIARHFDIRSYLFYVPVGAVLWLGIFCSGVHATIAGVIIGFLTPYQFSLEGKVQQSFSPIDDLIRILHPWVSFAIMPIFSLANAGIPLNDFTFSNLAENPIPLGVLLGLVLGKPLGILFASLFAVRTGFAVRSDSLKWKHLGGVACLAGIGFTMAIFVANLSLTPEHAVEAKIAILIASSISAVLGYSMLKWSLQYQGS